MKFASTYRDADGQALVELVLVLPVMLVLLLAAAWLTTQAATQYDIRERGNLSLRTAKPGVAKDIPDLPEGAMLPQKRREQEFTKAVRNRNLIPELPSLGRIFPGSITGLTIDGPAGMRKTLPTSLFPDQPEAGTRIREQFSILGGTFPTMDWRDSVRSTALPGIPSGWHRMLDTFGIDLFYINSKAVAK